MGHDPKITPIAPALYNKDEFLKKPLEVKVKYMGRDYTIVYHKDPDIKKILIQSINYNEFGKIIQSDEYNIKDKAYKVDDMVNLVKTDPKHFVEAVFKQILNNEGQIALGLTDVGHLDPHGKYHETTKNNIDEFSALIEKANFQSWAELEKWDTGKADWRDVIEPRFEIIRKNPNGKIHFNLTGMTKDNIIKSLQLKHDVPTGESAKKWGTPTTPSGTWKEQFGLYGLTYWELMQVIHNPELLKKTDFYIYDKESSATGIRLSAAVLKLDFGLDLQALSKSTP